MKVISKKLRLRWKKLTGNNERELQKLRKYTYISME